MFKESRRKGKREKGEHKLDVGGGNRERLFSGSCFDSVAGMKVERIRSMIDHSEEAHNQPSIALLPWYNFL
jgi:hypothetical protein